jgi:plasmid maintenance system antidote protein VapI
MKRNLALETLQNEIGNTDEENEPHTAADFLDALQMKMGVPSDYALARELGVTTTRISNWRTGRNTFDEGMAIQVAALLGMDPAYVLACAAAERTKRRDVKLGDPPTTRACGGAHEGAPDAPATFPKVSPAH